jgi:hypothetical protein
MVSSATLEDRKRAPFLGPRKIQRNYVEGKRFFQVTGVIGLSGFSALSRVQRLQRVSGVGRSAEVAPTLFT